MKDIAILLAIVGGIWGVFQAFAKINKHIKIKAQQLFDTRKRELEYAIEQKRTAAVNDIASRTKELNEKQQYVLDLKSAFSQDYVKGRKWLAAYISEADKAFDDQISNYLHRKKTSGS